MVQLPDLSPDAYAEMQERAIAAERELVAVRNHLRLVAIRRWGFDYRWRLAAMFPAACRILDAADARARDRLCR